MRKHKSCLATEAPQSWHVARFGTNKVTTTVVVTFAGKEIQFSISNFFHLSDLNAKSLYLCALISLSLWLSIAGGACGGTCHEGGVRTALASQNVTDNEMGGKRRER